MMRRGILAAIASCVLLGNTTQTHASFYKCVAEDGSTTYNDTPCAANESTHLLTKSAREIPALDCRIANNFAFDAVARMRQDNSAVDVFEAYGGAENVNIEVRNLIDYVYSFQNKRLVSAQRIVDLTLRQCRSGELGEALNQCETYPKEFIARFGSCLEARQSTQTGLIQRLREEDEVALRANTTGPGSAPPILQAANPAINPAIYDSDILDSIPDAGIRRRLEIFQQRALKD